MMTWNLYCFWKAHFKLKFPLMRALHQSVLGCYDAPSFLQKGVVDALSSKGEGGVNTSVKNKNGILEWIDAM